MIAWIFLAALVGSFGYHRAAWLCLGMASAMGWRHL